MIHLFLTAEALKLFVLISNLINVNIIIVGCQMQIDVILSSHFRNSVLIWWIWCSHFASTQSSVLSFIYFFLKKKTFEQTTKIEMISTYIENLNVHWCPQHLHTLRWVDDPKQRSGNSKHLPNYNRLALNCRQCPTIDPNDSHVQQIKIMIFTTKLLLPMALVCFCPLSTSKQSCQSTRRTPTHHTPLQQEWANSEHHHSLNLVLKDLMELLIVLFLKKLF